MWKVFRRPASLSGQIAIALNDKAVTLEQINQSITQVSQVFQSNSAAAGECAAANEELSTQADELKKCVGIFKLSDKRLS